jgi:2-dehydro-3-deoxyphosphogluconate aldolase/(4S)-4-hydroxy-2-oxoglutarate aldolase
MKSKIVQGILQEKIIAISRGVSADRIVDTAEALYRGGVRFLEITFDQSNDTSDTATLGMIETLSDAMAGRMVIGAGTVVTPEQIDAVILARLPFVVTPNTNPSAIAKMVSTGIVVVAGAFTPSEIVQAYQAGASFVKLFPAHILGFDYVKAIVAPLSNIPLIAVGGVDEDNVDTYLQNGFCGVGVGVNMVKNSLIEEGRYDELTLLAQKFREKISGM